MSPEAEAAESGADDSAQPLAPSLVPPLRPPRRPPKPACWVTWAAEGQPHAS
jgi:hypothetical protein